MDISSIFQLHKVKHPIMHNLFQHMAVSLNSRDIKKHINSITYLIFNMQFCMSSKEKHYSTYATVKAPHV